MNRRTFIYSGVISSLSLWAQAKETTKKGDPCVMKFNEITTEATGFKFYEHYHQLSIPISALIQPPAAGISVRTSMIDQGSYDFLGKQLAGFTKHSHSVKFSKQELIRIAEGEENVKITVLSPLGRFAHEFFFTAPKSALIKIAKAKMDPSFQLRDSSINDICLMKASEISVESNESPFFLHYHQLSIPVVHLIKPPTGGYLAQSSSIDLDAVFEEEMVHFSKSSGIKLETLKSHKHEVLISKEQLERIATGEKNVNVRAISTNGNYVHNFIFTASPSVLVKVKRGRG